MPITIAGSGTITGISAGGLPDGCIDTADLADGAATPAKTTGGPAFSAYRNGNVVISNATFTKVPFNEESFDTANCFDSTTNFRFTPDVAGYYFLFATTNIEPSTGIGAVNRLLPSLHKNGTEVFRGIDFLVAVNQTSVSGFLYLNGTTDYVEAYIYTTGATTPRISGGVHLTTFSGYFVRRA